MIQFFFKQPGRWLKVTLCEMKQGLWTEQKPVKMTIFLVCLLEIEIILILWLPFSFFFFFRYKLQNSVTVLDQVSLRLFVAVTLQAT